MMGLKQEVLCNVSKTLEDTIGITYDEFAKLDFDEQQRLFSEYRRKNKIKKDKYVDLMVGYGEFSTFTRVKKGELVMTRYGNFAEAGLTIEEERNRLEDDLDDVIYSKPVAFVKKIQRRVGNKFSRINKTR